MSVFKSYRQSLLLILAIFIGSVVGYFMQEKALMFESLANLFLNLLFCIVVPLIFVSLVSSIANAKSSSVFGKTILVMILVFLVSGIISGIFGLAFFSLFDFKTNVALSRIDDVKTSADVLSMFSVGNFYELFTRKNLIPLIVFALFFGVALLKCKEECKNVINFFSELNIVVNKMVNFIMMFAPIGLACFFAVLFGTTGKQITDDLAKAIIAFFLITPVYFIIHNAIFAYFADGINGVKLFFKNILTSVIVALGTCSSVAVIPSNIKAASNIGVNPNVNTLVTSLAASLHKPGSVVLAILKMAVVCAIFNIDLFTASNMIKAIIVAILIGSVVGPIPTGGYISEMLVVGAFNLPIEALPIVILIGTIADAPATLLNAASDVSATMVVNKYVGKKDE